MVALVTATPSLSDTSTTSGPPESKTGQAAESAAETATETATGAESTSTTESATEQDTSAATEAAAAAPGDSLIDARHAALGGNAGVLGSPTNSHYGVGSGRARNYQHGRIFWSTETGAWDVRGAVLDKFLARGGPTGALGFPTTGPAGSSVVEQVFGGGRIYSSSSTGTRALLSGATLSKYLALGGKSSSLGLPTSETAAVVGGSRTTFQRGRIFWSSPTGAHTVTGSVLSRYLSNDGAVGPLRFPTADTRSAGPSGSTVGVFTGGHIYASRATGSWVVWSGRILTKYLGVGGAKGRLGLPRGPRSTVSGGKRQVFAGGHIYESSASGAQTVERRVLLRFVKVGAGASYVGMPTTDTYKVSGGYQNTFRNGVIRSWTSSGGTKVTGFWRPATQGVTASQIPHTYRSGCPVGPSGLRRVLMPYYDWNDVPQRGRLVVRTSAADDMQRVFKRAFDKRFPIRRMNQVDAYNGSDVRSMEADNTSAFNCRKVTGNPYRLSQHSYGNAIDINTFENPYVTGSRVYPSGSRTYLNRSNVRKGMIMSGGAIASGMRAEGWPWGARWSNPDYQHFSSNGG